MLLLPELLLCLQTPFSDLQLVIKHFGSDVCLGSIQESFEKYIEAEKLDVRHCCSDTKLSTWLHKVVQGDNCYDCEKCEKKCEAIKGTKFNRLPYIMTLQIKRFDFDYTYMRRIKLNSK